MMILVGVTINVALNGGLFEVASKASKYTQLEMDKEELQAAVVGAYDSVTGKVDKAKLVNNLGTNWSVEGEEKFTCTSSKNNQFKVELNGTIKEKPELTLMEKYVLGEYGDGKSLDTILNFGNNQFEDDEATTIKGNEVSFLIFTMYEDSTKATLYAKYNDKAYKISAAMVGESFISQSVELIYEPSGREGEIVQYDSNGDGTKESWTILYDDGENIEIVSNNVIGSLTLGYGDTSAENLEQDINGDGTVDNIDKAMYSYDNAITRINEYSDEVITATDNEGVRSVGVKEDKVEYYASEGFNNKYTGTNKTKIKAGNTNYEQDLVRICYWNIENDGESKYWLATRRVEENSGNVLFGCGVMDEENKFFDNYYLWDVDSYHKVSPCDPTLGVCPVVLNPTGI